MTGRLVISIWFRAWPIMSNYSVIDVLHQSEIDSRSKLVGYRVGRDWRSNIVEAKPISYGPLLNEMWDRWETFLLAAPTLIINRRIIATMKFKKGNVVSARLTRDLHIVRCASRCIDIKGTGHGGKCCYAARHCLIASQDIAESGAIRFSGGKDMSRINAILALDVVEDVCSELNVVYSNIWNTLPKFLPLC